MTDKEKILLFLTNRKISKSSFYRKTGLSQGFLNSGNSIGVDKLKIIISAYPEFNYKSLLFDQTYATNEDSTHIIDDSGVTYQTDIKKELREIKTDLKELKEKITLLLDNKNL